MSDLAEIIQSVGFALDIGYWLVEVETRTVYWPRGLGRPPGVAGATGYRSGHLDMVTDLVDEADQGRFRGYLAELLGSDGSVHTFEMTIQSSWGTRIPVRLGGRKVGSGRESRIVGLVEVVTHERETERLAKSLGHIVEALFISSESGIVIFDADLHVRRLNRNALDLFGISDADEADGSYSSAIEAKMPQRVREHLREAIETSSAVSGTLTLGGLGAPRLVWRANPWGAGPGDMSGLVMVFDRKRLPRTADLAEIELRPQRPAPAPVAAPVLPPPPAPSSDAAPGRCHRALEWVKHPIVLASITTGEVVFANRAGRELYHLPPGKRCFVENLYDVTGFSCDPDPVAVVAAGGHLLRLRLGARVGRMFDYDDDLLFIEYHAEVPHPRPVTPVVHHAAR